MSPLLTGRLLLATLLIGMPFRHVESGAVHIDIQGRGVAAFKKHFSRTPTCTATSRTTHKTVTPYVWSKEWAEFHGTPGDILDWTCKHNPKGPR